MKARRDGPRGREGPGRRRPPLEELMVKFLLEGGRRGPRCAPLGRAALLAASPTARLALTWVISSGGDIYRVGARQGATPPSMPVHEVESGQGSSGPETCTHIIYTSQSRPPPLSAGHSSKGPGRQPPLKGPRRTPSRAILHTILHASHRGPGPPGVPPGPTHGGARPPLHPFPFSSIPFPPRRLPSIHLLLPTGECSGPTGTGARAPGRLACHAVDGWTAWWPRSMQRRPLSGYRHAATSPRPGTL